MGKGVLTGILVALSALVCVPSAVAADTTPPKTTVLLTNETYSGGVRFGFFTDDPAAAIDCRVDDRPWVGCKSADIGHFWSTPEGLVSGPHVAQIRSTDLAGNVEDPPFTHLFYVKPSPPTFGTANGAMAKYTAWTNDTTPSFRFETADPNIASFTCGVDWEAGPEDVPVTAQPEACGTDWAPSQPLSEGPHRVSVASNDVNGFTSRIDGFGFRIDSRPPVVTLITPGRVLKGDPVKIKLDAYDETGAAEKTCKLDRKPLRCRHQVLEDLKPGPHRISVYIRDKAGNESSAKAKFRVDKR